MSLGPLMIDIEGRALTAEDRDVLKHPLVGGVILFTRNFDSREQLQELVKQIHALRMPRLIVGVDHEGGPVQRFRDGFTHLPAASQLGDLYRHDPENALQLTREVGWLLAAELLASEIDLSFTPVLDIENKTSQVLKHRAYHEDPQVVAEMAHQLMVGMNEAGMQATGKHFPGHGGVKGDSHLELPIDDRSYEDIYAQDILPFERMIHYGLAAVMPAHVVYSQLDTQPAGFSHYWIQDVLRKQLEFNGVVFSDDLSMAGAHMVGGYLQRAEAALDAGCDVILVCNNREGAIEILDEMPHKTNPVLQMRIARMHGKCSKEARRFEQSPRWQKTVEEIRLLHDEYPIEQELNFSSPVFS